MKVQMVKNSSGKTWARYMVRLQPDLNDLAETKQVRMVAKEGQTLPPGFGYATSEEAQKAKGVYIDTSHADTNTCRSSPRGDPATDLFVSMCVVSI